MKPGPLIIVSGPSGSGKSTLIRRVLQEEKRFPLHLAVSATTRAPREGERPGIDYTFWTREQFEDALADGKFLEHATVHDNYYGTPRSEVDGYREKGTGVVLDIDVQGAMQVRPLYPDHVSVFIKLSEPGMYEQRLRRRASETEETSAKRMKTARRELGLIGEYQHVIVNDDDKLDAATAELRELIAKQFNP
jgi:guanylate kinase